MRLTISNSPRSTMKIVVLTTSTKSTPAAAKTSPRFCRTRRVSISIPPSTIIADAGSRPICPEQKIISRDCTACEYGPIAAGACLVWIDVFIANFLYCAGSEPVAVLLAQARDSHDALDRADRVHQVV